MISQVMILKKYGIKVKGDLGQHLLLDGNVIRKIISALNPHIGQTVVEIGPGLGALTIELLKQGVNVIAIEKDPKFVKILEDELAPEYPDTFHLLHADILKCNFCEICEGLGSVKLVSNLPYYITTKIMFKLIEEQPSFTDAVLMMQREVSEKLIAKPGSDKYARIAAATSAVGSVSRLFSVAKGCFTPAPKVDSHVLRFKFNEKPLLDWDLMPKFHEFIKVAFSERRKVLMTLLLSRKGKKPDRASMLTFFEACEIDPKSRADQLSAKQLSSLFLKIYHSTLC